MPSRMLVGSAEPDVLPRNRYGVIIASYANDVAVAIAEFQRLMFVEGNGGSRADSGIRLERVRSHFAIQGSIPAVPIIPVK